MDNAQYLGIFLDESRDLLQLLNDRLLHLETHRDDRPTLDEIFRAAHTLKGMAATMGFATLAELTHHMENLLEAVRKGTLAVDAELSDTLFGCVDAIGSMLEAIAQERSDPDITLLLARILEVASRAGNPVAPKVARTSSVDQAPAEAASPQNFAPPALDPFERAVVTEAQGRGFRAVWIRVRLAPGCLLKGVRAYMVVNALEQSGELIKTSPPVQDLEEERFGDDFALLLITRVSDDEIRTRLEDISEVAGVEVAALPAQGDTWQIQEVAAAPSQTAAPESPAPATPAPAERSAITGRPEPASVSQAPAPKDPQPATEPAARVAPTVRVSTERLDSLVNLVGELVIDRTRLQQLGLRYAMDEVQDVIRHVGSVITDVHGVVMKLRMMPVERVFSRFPRMVRDLGRELRKEVQLVIEGQDTELDRLMIDEIADPLLHLLRNSVDHGLESALERELLGKPATGTIWLRARHEGNHVILEVEDDGRGMDPERLKRKALDRGLLSHDEARALGDRQALDLIFMAGFSTRDQATDISGRGVGMDAVKSKAIALGGALDVSSTLGKGTLVTFILPLTLAIIQCMLTEVGDEIYAIPLNFIEDAHDMADLSVQRVQEEEMALLRGHSLPLVRLQQVLAVRGPSLALEGEAAAIITRVGSRRVGLVVDRLLGQQEVVIKPVSKLVGHQRYVSGASILGDGRLALILDVAAMA